MRTPFLFVIAIAASGLASFGLSSCAKDLPPMTGGFSDATKSSEARKVAEFAVRQQSARSGEALKLAAVVQAEQQVVAGMNYKMTLQVKSGPEVRTAQVMVYQSLAPQMMLASWEWVGE